VYSFDDYTAVDNGGVAESDGDRLLEDLPLVAGDREACLRHRYRSFLPWGGSREWIVEGD
jgi:hypothetical protein